MHLKSLTLKGFKSFASATTLRFEPGITAVVGPNGSGKSNVVDAITWVLGEQGAKALRGGKMEDVIFAGTAGRAPLGRAEVSLTIDNSDHALPIDYAEVSITRRMFRDGASEYEINGASARLLDIQELLSDSGIGREMHVIVGQGQLDSVLQARPEDRRGFVEEAAGVLKHRKRKERALRKLDAMQANLTRLTDLTGELRRQLKPLGRQAEVARRAAGVQAELRDSRLRLLADDLLTLRTQFAAEVADEETVRAERRAVDAELTAAREREAELDADQAAAAPELSRAQESWYQLTALEERFRGTSRLAAERHRHLSEVLTTRRDGRDPDVLEADAATVRRDEATLRAELDGAQARLTETVSIRQGHERALSEAERALVAAARAVADRREGLARLIGQVNALASRAEAGAEEMTRLATAAEQARARATDAEHRLEQVQAEGGVLDDSELGLDEQHEAALAAYAQSTARIDELTEQRREAERERSTWTARREALALGLTRKDGAGALLAAGDRLPGLLGSVAALVTVEPGFEGALAAALGAVADAVAVESAADATSALHLLKADDAGRAGLLVAANRADAAAPHAAAATATAATATTTAAAATTAGADTATAGTTTATNAAADTAVDTAGWPRLPGGARWAVDVVRAPDSIAGAIAHALARVAVVTDLAAAANLIHRHPDVRAVTPDGDVFAATFVVGGSASSPSAIEIQAAVDEAETRAADASARVESAAGELAELGDVAAAHHGEVERTLTALHESDARLAAVTEAMAELGQAARSAHAEAERLDAAYARAAQARERDLDALAEMQQRRQAAEEVDPADHSNGGEPSTDARDRCRSDLATARQLELDARLAVRTAEERARALAGRAEALEEAARAERAAQRREQQLRAARTRAAAVAAIVHVQADRVLVLIAASVVQAAAERDELQRRRAERAAELGEIRTRVRDLAVRVERLTDTVHRDEVLRAEQRLRIEQYAQRAVDEFGVEPDALIAEYGPDQPVPPSAQETDEYEQARDRGEDVVAPAPGPFHRPTQEKRAGRAERDLALLGKVNPLALEEFAALEERHQFLSTQLEDIKDTRRDLLAVVKEVDERILEVFTAAYHDVAREFVTVFATLFPGGEGRLILTNPDDMLATGIEVEARPPGKKVKRLSLLSGGERSLTAVALLVAIFRARPSPFYIMDEVEAALDEINLGRLIGLIGELRATSQLIIITHQKRTMEIADALYGVAMRNDGITQVISQRLREPVSGGN